MDTEGFIVVVGMAFAIVAILYWMQVRKDGRRNRKD